jgi:predicted nucleic acid-binding protein
VSRVVFLDSGPLGLASNPNRKPVNLKCAQWLQTLFAGGIRVVVPEISDYEVRRELLRAGKAQSVKQLDDFATTVEYLPISTAAMRQAATLWAQARQHGQPTANDKSIDADAILAAQAITLGVPDFVIATTNLGHLTRYAPAELWTNVTP